MSSHGPGIPLHDLDAEMAVLGSMLVSTEAAQELVQWLKETAFYRPAHQEIYRAMRQLVQESKAIDLVTMTNELRHRGSLDQVGGVDYLYQIAETVPSAANAAHYATIVHDLSTLRNLEHAGRQIVDIARAEGQMVKDKLDSAEQLVFRVGEDGLGKQFQSVKELTKDYFVDIDRLYETGQPQLGMATGFELLDAKTTGLYPGNLIVVAARPAMGKTAFVLSLAVNVAKANQGAVAFFSLEMSDAELVRRMIAMESGVPGYVLKRSGLNHQQYERLVEGASRLYELPLFIDDTSDLTPLTMRSKCRRLGAREGGLSLVVVDYLQLMRTDRRTENRVQEIGEIARSLKALSKDLKVPVIALSQLNRAVETRENKRPQLSDIRESGSIEAEADIVMMLYRGRYYDARGGQDFVADRDSTIAEPAEVIVAKHRNGPVGRVVLGFQPSLTKWVNLTQEDVDRYERELTDQHAG